MLRSLDALPEPRTPEDLTACSTRHVDVTPIVAAASRSTSCDPARHLRHQTALAIVEKKLEPYLGPQRALALQTHFSEVAEKGLGSASMKYLGDLQTKGLTVDVGNALTAHAVT